MPTPRTASGAKAAKPSFGTAMPRSYVKRKNTALSVCLPLGNPFLTRTLVQSTPKRGSRCCTKNNVYATFCELGCVQKATQKNPKSIPRFLRRPPECAHGCKKYARQGLGVCVPRPPRQKTGLPPPLDRQDQRRRPYARDFLFPPDAPFKRKRHPAEPQSSGRPGAEPPGSVPIGRGVCKITRPSCRPREVRTVSIDLALLPA